MKKILLPIGVATLLWFVMFSPLTAPHLNFWMAMTLSGIVLALLSFHFGGDYLKRSLKEDFRLSDIPLGVAIGALLWGVFWLGDKVAVWMFPFAEGQIGTIYSMRDGTSWTLIGALLLFIVGPAEEIFWRGYVQHSLGDKFSPTMAFMATTAVYTLVHIWSLNFMLLVAAAVAGGVWGLMYRLWPKRLWALVISHAVWDMAVFVLFPI